MKESLLTDVFGHAGFFLALSALVIPFLKYLKMPVVLGYLCAGVALGPYALGALSESLPWLEPFTLKDAEHVRVLAELGVVLLLFVIGLEITPRRLWQMRSLVFGLGGAQVFITSVVVGTVAYLWGNSVQVSILLGLGLSLSSTAIVIQWIHEQKLFSTPSGRSSFSILLLQDLAVIPILLLLTIMGTGVEGSMLGYVSFTLLKMAGTVLVIYFIGKTALKPVFVFASKYGGAEVFVALSLLIIVVSALVASFAGLSMSLGAFVAGLILADTEYRHEVSSLIVPFKSMLLGIFFLSFGMSIDLHFIAEKPFWIVSSVVGLMLIKSCIIFILCKVWKQTTAVSLENAILLSQAGEFGLLVVGGALSVGLMEKSVGQFMLIVIGITMLLAPVTAIVARRVGQLVEEKSHDAAPYHASQAEAVDQHIVIFGYGRVGQEIGDALCHEGYKIIGFEKDVEKVARARLNNAPVYLGKASHKSTLEAASLNEALCVVVTVDDADITKKIIRSVRGVNKSVPVVIRAHNIEDQEEYSHFENVEAIAENVLMSKALSEKVFSYCGFYNRALPGS